MKCPHCGEMLTPTEEQGIFFCATCQKKYKIKAKAPAAAENTPAPKEEKPSKKTKTKEKPSTKPVKEAKEDDDDYDPDQLPQPKGIKDWATFLVAVLVKKQGSKKDKKMAYTAVAVLIGLLIGVTVLITVLKGPDEEEPLGAVNAATEVSTEEGPRAAVAVPVDTETEVVVDTETTQETTESKDTESTEPAETEQSTEEPTEDSTESSTEAAAQDVKDSTTGLVVTPTDLDNIETVMKIVNSDEDTVTADLYWKTYIPLETVRNAQVGDQIAATDGLVYTVVPTQEMLDYMKMDGLLGFDTLTERSDIVLCYTTKENDEEVKYYYAIGKATGTYCTIHGTESKDFAPKYYVLASGKVYRISSDVRIVFYMINEKNMIVDGTVENGVLTRFTQR